ncbi:MAG: outer membrane beta-barrel protein [Alcanivoracaceae bacterium]|jgi:opacity protein-like surface antigen|nr:outer membrane beta-barrel protein [Alcanivoracaceae bacterium]
MRTSILSLLGCCMAVAAQAAPQDELAPPDVTFYIGAQATQSDLGPFDQDNDGGLRLRFGGQFNEARWGDWTWSFEGSLTRLADATSTTYRVRSADAFDPPELDRRFYQTDTNVRINGFELGTRLYDGRLFFARAGAYIYSLKRSRDVLVTEIFNDATPPRTTAQLPTSDTITRIGPYLGGGVNAEVTRGVYLNAQYDGFFIDGEYVNSAAAGVELRF